MKKRLLLLTMLCLSHQTFAKVSYEDAIESNRPYHDANGAVHIPPDTKGLGPDELPDTTESAGENEMGTWQYENRYSTQSSYKNNRVEIGDSNGTSQYALEGTECLQGLKGYFTQLGNPARYYQYTCK